ncbi:TFIIB-type zinc ribbon-containing protein [Natronomonas sp. EA1]|uniref:TFIIB-type zinc ribbon-containing protein n=1 Tax=Natronomonas sp. EA1 TaxID=3421655 RepID=UPI003EB90E72
MQCPECGSSDIEKRYVTGGGWRAVYRCRNCGRVLKRPGPTRKVAPVAVATGALGAAWLYLRRLGGKGEEGESDDE